jgi:hypothetical protein
MTWNIGEESTGLNFTSMASPSTIFFSVAVVEWQYCLIPYKYCLDHIGHGQLQQPQPFVPWLHPKASQLFTVSSCGFRSAKSAWATSAATVDSSVGFYYRQ